MIHPVSVASFQKKEKLHSSEAATLYRAIGTDGRSKILKVLNTEYPTPERLSRFHQEYEMTINLFAEEVVHVESMSYVDQRLTLVMEDFGGVALSHIIQQSHETLDLITRLKIAIQITQAIDTIHSHQIIHKDIKPANIILNLESGQVKLTDFSIATQADQSYFSTELEGTLAYLSPEQTGRMNRPIDYRSDFYSFGVTLYELFTGYLPFETQDPLEMVHCHIAKIPTPLQVLNPDVPDTIAQIIEKLMEKNAENRYQSSQGILIDLERCLKELETTGRISYFEVGKIDRISQFKIPKKLYGRSQQIEKLMNCFDRVKNGAVEIVLIAGYSGIGKTALVRELEQSIRQAKGYLITGKFDQFKRENSTSSIIDSHRLLIQEILTREASEIEQWRSHFKACLSKNAQLIINLIPELELIIGPQPPLQETDSIAAKQQYIEVFEQFNQAIFSMEIPHVSFMDDIQWADHYSMSLLSQVAQSSEIRHTLFLGAYRENEMDSSHPAMNAFAKIQQQGKCVETIILKPFELKHILELLAETLNMDLKNDRLKPLAQLLYDKTQGNPFFLTQLLKSLYDQKSLIFDYQCQEWQWDIIAIQQQAITDNVVDFMVDKLRELPEVTQIDLQLAACIGDTFDLKTIAVITDRTPLETLKSLSIALDKGFILVTNDESREDVSQEKVECQNQRFKFLHDRVQQAAYCLIPKAEQQLIHLKIGRLLYQSLNNAEKQEQIFDLVNHFNVALEEIQEIDEKFQIAELNYFAGKKAKAAVMYAVANQYFENALSLMPHNCWENHYEFTLNFYREFGDAAFLNSHFDRSEQLVNTAIHFANTAIEKAEFYNILILQYTSQGKYQEAIEAGKTGLRLVGVDIDEQDIEQKVEHELALLRKKLEGRSILDLVNLPVLTEEHYRLILRLLSNLDPVAYLSSQINLFSLLTAKAVNFSLQYGNMAESVKSYLNYGCLLGSIFGEYYQGYEFGVLARTLSKKFQSLQQQARANMILSSWIQCWVKPFRGLSDLNLAGFYAANESGEVLFAGYNLFCFICNRLIEGIDLNQILKDIETYSSFIENSKNQLAVEIIQIAKYFICSFQNSVSESDLTSIQQIENSMALGILHIYECQRYYCFGNAQKALEQGQLVEQYLPSLLGFNTSSDHSFYMALSLIACLPDLEPERHHEYLDQISAHQARMQTWTEFCPENFKGKLLLIQAELDRFYGRTWEAINAYDESIEQAKLYGFTYLEAIATQQAASLYFELGKQKIAVVYLKDAHAAYARWGAIAKVEAIETEYAEFFPRNLQKKGAFLTSQRTQSLSEATVTQYSNLDLSTVIQASHALSSQVVMEHLLEKLMQLVQENAGAQRIIFIRQSTVGLSIEAILTGEDFSTVDSVPLNEFNQLPQSVIQYAERTQEPIILDDASRTSQFRNDPYIKSYESLSILVFPIVHQQKLMGLLYLENELIRGAFTQDRLGILGILATQAAISLENAQFYAQLEARVADRTQALQQTLKELNQTQLKLIQSEKMSSLGQLVGGIAHELNNPINFIYANLQYVQNYSYSLIELVQLYQSKASESDILDYLEEIEFDFILEDFPAILKSIENGATRVRDIVLDLRNFARLDESEVKSVDLNIGLENTLKILSNRLGEIQVQKNYGELPIVTCYAGKLNQVFLNLMNNAIDALAQNSENPTIQIRSEMQDSNHVAIVIKDNGMGIEPEVLAHIFDPFFTTKPVGTGTGLGLAISHQVVVAQHQGQLVCKSQPHQGTEFTIVLPISQPT